MDKKSDDNEEKRWRKRKTGEKKKNEQKKEKPIKKKNFRKRLTSVELELITVAAFEPPTSAKPNQAIAY